MQGHRHASLDTSFVTRGSLSGAGGSAVAAGFSFFATTGGPVTDGANGTPRLSSETRGAATRVPPVVMI